MLAIVLIWALIMFQVRSLESARSSTCNFGLRPGPSESSIYRTRSKMSLHGVTSGDANDFIRYSSILRELLSLLRCFNVYALLWPHCSNTGVYHYDWDELIMSGTGSEYRHSVCCLSSYM